MQKLEKSELYGGIGSVVFAIFLLLLLFLLKFTYKQIIEPAPLPLAFSEIEEAYEGIKGSEGASGKGNYVRLENPTVLTSIKSKTSSSPAQNYTTQTIEENIAIERAKVEQQRREAEAAELLRQQQDAERQRIAAEQQAKTDRAKGQMSGLFGSGNGGTGAGNASGNGTGSGNSGASGYGSNPVGSGTSNGHSWSLKNRNLIGKILTPRYNENVEGIIVVSIRVDENGNVASATIDGAGTTIVDETLRNSTLASAKQQKFSAGTGVVSGKIEYKYKLR